MTKYTTYVCHPSMIVSETPKAFQLTLTVGQTMKKRFEWFPKSQVDAVKISGYHGGGNLEIVVLTLPEWLAREKQILGECGYEPDYPSELTREILF